MGKNSFLVHLVVVFCLGMVLPCLCVDDPDNATSDVYVVTLRHAPASQYYGELKTVDNGFKHDASGRTQFHKPRYSLIF